MMSAVCSLGGLFGVGVRAGVARASGRAALEAVGGGGIR